MRVTDLNPINCYQCDHFGRQYQATQYLGYSNSPTVLHPVNFHPDSGVSILPGHQTASFHVPRVGVFHCKSKQEPITTTERDTPNQYEKEEDMIRRHGAIPPVPSKGVSFRSACTMYALSE